MEQIRINNQEEYNQHIADVREQVGPINNLGYCSSPDSFPVIIVYSIENDAIGDKDYNCEYVYPTAFKEQQ